MVRELFFKFRNVFRGSPGVQSNVPESAAALDEQIGVDAAMQVSAEYACVKLISSVVASLPLMVYEHHNGIRTPIDRSHPLWRVLHNAPNDVMTSCEFWTALLSMFLTRGNAYAQIIRDEDTGDLIGLYPLYSDQMKVKLEDNGRLTYIYSNSSGVKTELTPENVFHLKDLGNGYQGLAKLEFMNASLNESIKSQRFAVDNASTLGKPSGILSINHTLKDEKQRAEIHRNLHRYRRGDSKILLLEADMKFQQATLSPEQLQLLETRKFGIEEICRWNGVPPILIGAPGATTWGTGISEIMTGFYKLTLSPLLKNIEQALTMRVLTVEEQMKYTIEFNLDALLRGDIKTRYEAYSIAVRNGFKTRNEIRQLENEPPIDGADELTAESNLVPLDKMGVK